MNYVAEVNYLAKPGDVFNFHRKSVFAEKRLGKEIKPIMITMSITEAAKKKCEALGVDLITGSVVPT